MERKAETIEEVAVEMMLGKLFRKQKTADKQGKQVEVIENIQPESVGPEGYREPKTLDEVVAWINRAGMSETFQIHKDLFSPDQSEVVYITVAETCSLGYLVGTHSLPYLKDQAGKELDHVIGFLASFGVNPDWEIKDSIKENKG